MILNAGRGRLRSWTKIAGFAHGASVSSSHRLHSSRLVSLLQQWTREAGASTAEDVAQGLSRWLSAFDAVKLNGALHAIEAHQIPGHERVQAVDVDRLEADVQRVRSQLAELIAPTTVASRPARGRGERPPVEQAIDPRDEMNAATQRQRYQGLQKQIEARLDELRTLVRQRLARGALPLRQLAALDAVLANMLGEHEQRLWATLAGYLEGRLRHWRQAHEQALAAGQEDDPRLWRQPGAWLHAFEQDMRALLLAELQLRLSPITGLLEAARNANKVQA